ncbi:MAG: S26 family signal peptidase [Anaerolineales bacterium]|jgi:signal peptidase I
MIRLVKVSGDSLLPVYREGDFVLISKIPFFFHSLSKGDVIVFRHEIYGTMIKLVQRVDPEKDQIFVVGTREQSVDSRQFGPVQRKDLLGKVIWHIPKPLS